MMIMILMNSVNSKTMCRVLSLLLTMALLLRASTCSGNNNVKCVPSSCGDIQNISSPFRLRGDPKDCGDPSYELACENNSTVLYLNNSVVQGPLDRYYVRSIYYINDTYGLIRVVDDGLQKDDSCFLPRHPLTCFDVNDYSPYYCFSSALSTFSFLNCSKPVDSPLYVNATEPCMKTAHNSSSSNVSRRNNYYLYAMPDANASDVEDFCTIYNSTLAPRLTTEKENRLNSYDHIHKMMMDGFNLSYYYYDPMPLPRKKAFLCYIGLQYLPKNRFYDFRRPWFIPPLYRGQSCGVYTFDGPDVKIIWARNVSNFIIFLAHFIAVKFIVGAPLVLIFLIYHWRRRNVAMDPNVEEFLEANNNFLPIRYSYSDIKKITKNFQHKLGEGGYGSVYRGKLRSGSEVAVKVLKKSKANGQDFINEISTIGRIHHVNVVQLIGFCFEGFKQALIYHFMPNGSLDKHIFAKVDNTLLDCKKIFEIALGVARGVEYLHRGCDMQILHFDIKPHNILLDENYTPKISDFGLAKLYPTNHSTISLTAAKGTLGYMAPEFFYKDIGGISYKADVYSFGMLLMEMAGRRRNINANTECSSRIYFPTWIYDQLDKRKLLELEEIMEDGREVTMKMIIVALWCIQLNPGNRPSMRKVINMLEGDIDELQVPPKPHLYPIDLAPIIGDGENETELETFSSSTSAPLVGTTSQYETSCGIWRGNTM